MTLYVLMYLDYNTTNAHVLGVFDTRGAAELAKKAQRAEQPHRMWDVECILYIAPVEMNTLYPLEKPNEEKFEVIYGRSL